MRLKVAAVAIALVGALALSAASADAQTDPTKKKKTVVYNRDRTVQISRDEDGRVRTRIIIQRRSYLDPGTETFPGERSDHGMLAYPITARPACLITRIRGNQTCQPWTRRAREILGAIRASSDLPKTRPVARVFVSIIRDGCSAENTDATSALVSGFRIRGLAPALRNDKH
jgi:hypothetical protein